MQGRAERTSRGWNRKEAIDRIYLNPARNRIRAQRDKTRISNVFTYGPKESRCFSRRYQGTCRATGVQPFLALQDPCRLDIPADPLTLQDWRPLLQALAKDDTLSSITVSTERPLTAFLDWITTEEGVKKSKQPPICTYYLMDCLMESLGRCLATTESLLTLKLNHLWLKGRELLETFSMGLKKCGSLQELHFEHCAMTELGLSKLCHALAERPNIKTLKLVNCNITATMVVHISHLIKTQKIREKKGTYKKGLENLILNENPSFGDEGLKTLIEAIYETSSIKAVELQNCGLTISGAEVVLKLAQSNKELRSFDIRRNAEVSIDFIRAIRTVLKPHAMEAEGEKQENLGQNGEYSQIFLDSENASFDIELSQGHLSSSSKGSSKPRKKKRKANSIKFRKDVSEEREDRRGESPGPRECFEGDERLSWYSIGNPFARINEGSIKAHINKAKVKLSSGKQGCDPEKSAFQHILDGTVQELFDAMEPGEQYRNTILTPFGKGTDISVKDYASCVVPKAERRFSNAYNVSYEIPKGINSSMNKNRSLFKKVNRSFRNLQDRSRHEELRMEQQIYPSFNMKTFSSKIAQWSAKYRDKLVNKVEGQTEESKVNSRLVNEDIDPMEGIEGSIPDDSSRSSDGGEQHGSSEAESSVELIMNDKTWESEESFDLSNAEQTRRLNSLQNLEPQENQIKVKEEEKAENREKDIISEDSLRVPKCKGNLGLEGQKSYLQSWAEATHTAEGKFGQSCLTTNSEAETISLAVPKGPKSFNRARGPSHRDGCSRSISKEVGQTIDDKLRWARKTFGLEEEASELSFGSPSVAPYLRKALLTTGTKEDGNFEQKNEERLLCMVEKSWQKSSTSKCGNIVFFEVDKPDFKSQMSMK